MLVHPRSCVPLYDLSSHFDRCVFQNLHQLFSQLLSTIHGGNCDSCHMSMPVGAVTFHLPQDCITSVRVGVEEGKRPGRHQPVLCAGPLSLVLTVALNHFAWCRSTQAVLWPASQVLEIKGQMILYKRMQGSFVSIVHAADVPSENRGTLREGNMLITCNDP